MNRSADLAPVKNLFEFVSTLRPLSNTFSRLKNVFDTKNIVIVGSRGIGAVRRALMGSVSSALANNCEQK